MKGVLLMKRFTALIMALICAVTVVSLAGCDSEKEPATTAQSTEQSLPVTDATGLGAATETATEQTAAVTTTEPVTETTTQETTTETTTLLA